MMDDKDVTQILARHVEWLNKNQLRQYYINKINRLITRKSLDKVINIDKNFIL